MAHAARRLLRFALQFLLVLALSVEGTSWAVVATMDGMGGAESMPDARSMPCHGMAAEVSPAHAADEPVDAGRLAVNVPSDHSPMRHPPCCADDHCHCAGSHAAPSLGAHLPLRHGWAARDRVVAPSDHYRSPDLDGLIRPPIV